MTVRWLNEPMPDAGSSCMIQNMEIQHFQDFYAPVDFVDPPETARVRELLLRILEDIEEGTRCKMRQRGLSDRELAALQREHLTKIAPVTDQLVRIEQRSVRHIMVAT